MRRELISIHVKNANRVARISAAIYARYFERRTRASRYKSGIETGPSVNSVFNDFEHFENSPNDPCA